MPGRGAANAVPKPTAVNLRRFAETPVARRAINLVKDRIASHGLAGPRAPRLHAMPRFPTRPPGMAALRRSLEEPNAGDSLPHASSSRRSRTCWSAASARSRWRPRAIPERPFHLWAVDGAAIEIDTNWNGDPSTAAVCAERGRHRDAQRGAAARRRADVPAAESALAHPVRAGPAGGRVRDDQPVPQRANKYAGRLASNSVVQYALWLNEATPEQHDRLIRWWQDEIEGTGRVPILSCEKKPEVMRFAGGTDADLRLRVAGVPDAHDRECVRPAADAAGFAVGREQVDRVASWRMRRSSPRSCRWRGCWPSTSRATCFAKRLGWREFEFCFNELETRNEMEELQIQTGLLKAGVLTVDEVRAMRGLPSRAALPPAADAPQAMAHRRRRKRCPLDPYHRQPRRAGRARLFRRALPDGSAS